MVVRTDEVRFMSTDVILATWVGYIRLVLADSANTLVVALLMPNVLRSVQSAAQLEEFNF